MEAMVVVARDHGEDATIEVPEGELSGLHYASFAGGRGGRVRGSELAAYMLCTAIPFGRYFGHSCEHGPPPHRIKVLIPRRHNDPEVYARLQARAR
jgi:hypothetical protein